MTSSTIYKQVIVVRTDLDMGKGKIAAQVAHAAVNTAFLTKESHPAWFDSWWDSDYFKIVLKVDSLEELERIRMDAIKAGIPTTQIKDRGLTQIAVASITCIGLGPAPAELIDRVTGHLRVLGIS